MVSGYSLVVFCFGYSDMLLGLWLRLIIECEMVECIVVVFMLWVNLYRLCIY